MPEVVHAAEQSGGLTPTGTGFSGMTMDNASNVLSQMGVPNHLEGRQGLEGGRGSGIGSGAVEGSRRGRACTATQIQPVEQA